MKKICIIHSKYILIDSSIDEWRPVINQITDWTSISDEDYEYLKKIENKIKEKGLFILTMDTDEFLKTTINDFIKAIKKEEEDKETAKLLAEKNKNEKNKEKRMKQYEALKKEFETTDTTTKN